VCPAQSGAEESKKSHMMERLSFHRPFLDWQNGKKSTIFLLLFRLITATIPFGPIDGLRGGNHRTKENAFWIISI
jgi:hypothetical protein